MHGPESIALNKKSDKDKFLVKVIITPLGKQLLRSKLELYGITEAKIFPDLEHLAKELSVE